METKNIQEFIALAELGSSYAAAEKLFVSQSSLVRHIQAIEEEFGMPLFERTRKGFILNGAGMVFLPYARKIATLQARCYKSLHHADMEDPVIHLCAEGKIIDLMIDFKKDYPEYMIDYQKCPDAKEALHKGELDLAFLTNVTPGYAEEFQVLRYSREEVLILVYEEHPLARREKVTLEELRNEPFIALCDDVVWDENLNSRIGALGVGKNIVASVPTGSDVQRMVREKVGLAMIHGNSSTIPGKKGLKVLQLDPPITYDLSICYRNDVPLSKAAELFVQYAKKWRAFHPDTNQSLIEVLQ